MGGGGVFGFAMLVGMTFFSADLCVIVIVTGVPVGE